MWDLVYNQDQVDLTCGPFLTAALKGDLETLKEQLTAGADLKQTDVRGATALILAASKGHVECVKELIKSGAYVNTKDDAGMTGVMHAAHKGHEQCLSVLTDAGANVNIQTLTSLKGCTALGMAIKQRHVNTVKILLNAGADVHSCVEDTNSALHLAAHSCYGPFQNHLWLLPDNFVSRGIELGLPEKNFKKVLEEANVEAALDCLRLLLKSGARTNTRNKYNHNCLESYIAECDPLVPEVGVLLLAAGETLEGASVEKTERFGRVRQVEIPDFLKITKEDFRLKEICREAIRKYFIQLDPHANLFVKMPKLELPSMVTEFLLLDVELDSN